MGKRPEDTVYDLALQILLPLYDTEAAALCLLLQLFRSLIPQIGSASGFVWEASSHEGNGLFQCCLKTDLGTRSSGSWKVVSCCVMLDLQF